MGALIRMHDIDIPAAPPVLLSLPTGTHTDIPSDSMTSNDDAEVLQLVADSRLTGYLAAAALSLLTYDHIVCFPQEVTLVWKSRHGNAKILYLWNRYFSLVAIATNMTVMVLEVSSDKACMSWLRVQCISSTVIVGTVDFVLMCRVWMLYGRLRSFLWLFGCMVIAEVVVMLGVGFIAIERMPKYVHLGSLVTGCYAYNAPRFLAFTAGAPAVVTSVMFAMTVYKCTTTLTRISHHGMPTWKLFLRDGVFWFLAVFIAAAAELSVWATHRESLKEVLAIPALVVYSVVSSRALLNIKELMATDLEADARETDFSNTIVFASPVDSSC